MRSVPIAVALPLAISLAPMSLLAQQPSKEMAQAVAAYAAKITASALFVSGRSLDSVLAQELAPTRPLEALIKPLLRFEIDREQRRVTCRLGQARATAQCLKALGCTLLRSDEAPNKARREFVLAPALSRSSKDQPNHAAAAGAAWPYGEALVAELATGIDKQLLQAAV